MTAEACGQEMYVGHGYKIPCANVRPCPDHPWRRPTSEQVFACKDPEGEWIAEQEEQDSA